MLIRFAEEKDIPFIADIYNAAIVEGNANAFTEKLPQEYFKAFYSEHSKEKYPLVVAEIGGRCVGFSYISPYRKERKALSNTGEISFYVADGYRQSGVATELIQKIENLAWDIGYVALFAIILDTNTKSIRLMEKLGYEKWAVLPKIVIKDDKILGQVYYGKNNHRYND